MIDSANLTIVTVFFAGLLSFFAPCTFVTLPTFISYLVLRSTGETKSVSTAKYRTRVLASSLAYAGGFLLVFILLGMTATAIGFELRRHSDIFMKAGAVFIILFGLFILLGERLPKLEFMFREKKVEFKSAEVGNSYLYPFLIGTTNAFAWTPCIGPVLGGILFLAGSTSDTVFQGGFLLLVYGLGIILPFLLVALFFGSARQFMKKFNRYTGFLHKLSAALLLVLGVMLLFNDFFKVNELYGLVYRLFISLGYQPV